MGNLRIALCQLDATVGDLEGNADKVIALVARAESAGAQLAVFPELVLTGYPPEDLLLEPGFVRGNLLALEKVAAATQHCAAVVGFVEEDGDLYNAAAVCAGGQVRASVRKQLLPNYGVFDERRYFVPGAKSDRLFLIGGVRVGVTVCEDAWSPSGPVGRLGDGGAELVVTINASPYRAGILAQRERMLATRAADASCALAYVNLVGGQDELVFDGASMVFDHDGDSWLRLRSSRRLSPSATSPSTRCSASGSWTRGARCHVVLAAVGDLAALRALEGSAPATQRRRRSHRSRRDWTGRPRSTRRSCSGPGLRPQERLQRGSGRAVRRRRLLSCGHDRSRRPGPGRVHGVLMPSRFSSAGSFEDASSLVANLGIGTTTVPIEAAHGVLLQMLAPVFGDGDPCRGLAGENLQARYVGSS